MIGPYTAWESELKKFAYQERSDQCEARILAADRKLSGPSQIEACMRLIDLHGLGIINLAKISSDDREETELKQKYRLLVGG